MLPAKWSRRAVDWMFLVLALNDCVVSWHCDWPSPQLCVWLTSANLHSHTSAQEIKCNLKNCDCFLPTGRATQLHSQGHKAIQLSGSTDCITASTHGQCSQGLKEMGAYCYPEAKDELSNPKPGYSLLSIQDIRLLAHCTKNTTHLISFRSLPTPLPPTPKPTQVKGHWSSVKRQRQDEGEAWSTSLFRGPSEAMQDGPLFNGMSMYNPRGHQREADVGFRQFYYLPRPNNTEGIVISLVTTWRHVFSVWLFL